MSHKRIFILLFILPVILFSITGCTYLQEAGIIQPQQEKPAEQPEAQPQPEKPPEQPEAQPQPESSRVTPPSPASPIDGELYMHTAPALGEIVEVTFSFYSRNPSEILKAKIEFEKYDPALYYPLGKGREREKKLQLVAENSGSKDPYYTYLREAAEEEPEISVPQESLLVSGDLNWEGSPAEEGGEIDLTATIRFPEEGEWLIKGWLGGEKGSGHTYDVMYLIISKESGTFGWAKDFSKGSIWAPPNQEDPMSITIKPSQAPLLGEPFQITVRIKSIEDLAQAEGNLEFFRMEGTELEIVPLEDILIDGNLTWQGSLKKDTLIELSGTVMFPEEGDWGILEWSRPKPESISMNRNGIFIHIGKDRSRFGWTESH